MKQPLFTGVCTALVTPFSAGGVHYSMLERLIRRQLDCGIEAIVLSGTTGESPTLCDDEKLALFQMGKEFTHGEGIVIAGTGSNDTRHAIALSQRAEDAGADALLVVTPYYNKATPSGLLAHYQAIAAAVHIPIILYNVPGRTGVDIPETVVRELAKLPNMAGIKEASTDIRKIARLRALCPPDFAIWSGNDDLTLPAIAMGAKGVISVTSNVVPVRMLSLAQAALAGDLDTAEALHYHLLPLMEALFSEVSPIPTKAALTYLGYDCGPCRLPLTPMTEANREKLFAILDDL